MFTKAEQRVFDLLVTGTGNVEIAGALGVSPLTVKNHVSRILEKLELPSRTAVAHWHYSAEIRRLTSENPQLRARIARGTDADAA